MELNQVQEEKKKEEGDKLTNAIGALGKWQVMMLLVIVWPTKISAAWQQLGIIFLAPNTTFLYQETNLTDKIEMSQCYSDCVKYEYFTEFGNTIISQWDLICDRAWMANLTQTLNMFGVLLGSILFGFVADRYGRRPALLTASLLQLATTMAEAFCPTYWSFTIVRFFLGISTAGTLLCAFIFIMELTGPRKRELVGCLGAIPLAIGEMTMPIIAYFLRSYDMFCLGVAVPNLLYLVYFFMMPESPKWLISMGRLEEASVVMKQAANWNNLPSDNMMDVAKSIAAENVDPGDSKQGKATYLDLLKTKALRRNILGTCTMWLITGITFYGSNQYIGQTSSNVFISILLAGALQIPGIILGSIMCKYIGRRVTLISLYSLCSLSNAMLAVPDDWFYVKLVMGSVGVSCASGAFGAIYMYTTELFPTVARNMAMGASSTASRVGSMVAPFVAGLNVFAPWLPPAAFAIVPIVAAIACYCLPETRGKTLSDHIA
ncbi:organic cation/carnitine transporter 2-like [Anticarsia gemmatalis]|uniref:organic cation/carnitine transporter 2-like n=1 Tax=Anticarsia gemmatalis TaxID=129554 RepID=UPI003F758B56